MWSAADEPVLDPGMTVRFGKPARRAGAAEHPAGTPRPAGLHRRRARGRRRPLGTVGEHASGIAADAVAHGVESIGAIRFTGPPRRGPMRPHPDERLQGARSCCGHLAGAVAVGFRNSLLEPRWVRRDGRRFAPSTAGAGGLTQFLQCRRDNVVLISNLTPAWTGRSAGSGGRRRPVRRPARPGLAGGGAALAAGPVCPRPRAGAGAAAP